MENMDLLGVMGSPRKGGNTHLLLKEALEAAESVGMETEMIFLGDLEIKECDGCHACWRGEECPKRDHMNDIYRKLGECGGLLLGTPVYWFAPSGLMKLFVDRLVYFNCKENRVMVRGKRASYLIPYQEGSHDTAWPVVDFFKRTLNYLEMEMVNGVLAPNVDKRGEVRNHPGVMERARNLGRMIVPRK